MLSSRRKLVALCGACVAFGLLVLAMSLALPAQGFRGDAGRTYSYVYSGVKSSSRDFVASICTEDSHALFGASSLSTPVKLVAQVPVGVFGAHDYGMQLVTIGESYDQSLWHAIAAGAYAPVLPQTKVAIIVTPNWFFDGGIDDGVFESRFSFSLYRDFCANEDVSGESRAYLEARLLEQGIEQDVVDAGMARTVVDEVNGFFYGMRDDLRLRNGLRQVRERGFVAADLPLAQPDFAALQAQALVDGRQGSSNNSWSFDNASWDADVAGREAQIEGALDFETLQDTPEYDDLAFFLRVCAEVGLEPLVILSPLNGYYYDWVGIEQPTREACYERIRAIVAESGAALADYGACEYEPYFLHDQVHFGWIGWACADQALYDFMGGGQDAQAS